jgi:hypothetical protein
MPRYFFDTQDGFHHEDEEGQVLDNEDRARLEAIDAVRQMAADHRPVTNKMEFTCSVRNEAGGVVYRARLTVAGEWVTAPVDAHQERACDPPMNDNGPS